MEIDAIAEKPSRSIHAYMTFLSQKKNFLFDWDGTLVDTETLHIAAFSETLKVLAPEILTSFSYDQLRGLPTDEAFRKLGVRNEPLVVALTKKKRSFYLQLLGCNTDPQRLAKTGANELLQIAKLKGHRLFVVTGGSKRSVQLLIENLGWAAYFSDCVFAEDVQKGKPDPESYRLCMMRNQLQTHDSIVIEDGQAGIESALAAGLDVISLLPGYTHKSVRSVTSLKEIALLLEV